MKKSILLKLSTLICLIALSLSSLTGCYCYLYDFFTNDDTTLELTLVSEAQMSYTFDEESGLYEIKVEGVCENATGTDLNGGYVAVTVYDSEGNIIATPEEYVSYIKAGERWRFCAVGTGHYIPASFKITELSGW